MVSFCTDGRSDLWAGGTVLRRLCFVLSDKVVLWGACSTPWPLKDGVPPSSTLSPTLFNNIYARPLGEVVTGSGLGCPQYADDL